MLIPAAAVAPFDSSQAQHFAIDPEMRELVEPGEALATDPDGQILSGFRLFDAETFGGNGRTCASCHPAENNFTIDPAFIRTLPRRDRLFVAELEPALRNLEVPFLMRRNGLIVENADGFDQLGVMRGVPHILGLGLSIANSESPLAGGQALGWSGDGAPGRGTLREFAIGAVVQHFPKTLNRRACSRSEFEIDPTACDFRLPTEAELDALLAFQLFTGREEEVNIDPSDPEALVFTDDFVERGKELFAEAPSVDGTRSCNFCHNNAGANSNGNNRQFATGVRRHPRAPACRRRGMPGDGGFGAEPDVAERITCFDGVEVVASFQGDGSFNTPSLIEAADTLPLFHNNAATSVEDSVAFYTTDVFSESAAGAGNAFVLTDREIKQIAALLRALNVLENMRSSNEYARFALRVRDRTPTVWWRFARIARADIKDALHVLRDSPKRLFANTNVRDLLRAAWVWQRWSIRQRNPDLLLPAIFLTSLARDQLIE